MKNADMVVSKLLKEKSELEGEIYNLERACDSLYGRLQVANNFKEIGSVCIYSPNSTYKFTADRGLVQMLADEMLKAYKGKLAPVEKKLEAIEMMLKS